MPSARWWKHAFAVCGSAVVGHDVEEVAVQRAYSTTIAPLDVDATFTATY